VKMARLSFFSTRNQLDGSKNHWHFGVIADSVWLGDAGDRQWRDSRDFSTLTSG
jgi:hypothetical protein